MTNTGIGVVVGTVVVLSALAMFFGTLSLGRKRG